MHQRALLGLVTLASLAFADAEPAQAEMAYRPVPLWGGMHLKALDMSEYHRDINVMVPLPTLPYGPPLAYNHHQYEARAPMTGVETGGGSRSLLAKLPFGLMLEAGQRLDRFGRRRDDFVGLSFTLTDKRVALRHVEPRALGVDRGAPMPSHIDAERGLGGFWRIAGSVALLAVLAGGGGGSSRAMADDAPLSGGDTGWQLVWQDGFDGTTLNAANWSATDSYGRENSIGACWGGGNDEAQCYTSRPQNVLVEGGNLVLTARVEDHTASGSLGAETRSYTSGRVQTNGKRDFKYGRFEARIKLPTGDGVWPAFWMLPSAQVYGGWPYSGEIDIMENADGNASIGGALHYNNPQSPSYNPIYQTRSTAAQPTQWNTYRVDWHPDEINWYLNDQPYFSVQKNSWRNGANAVGTSDHAPFDQDFHLILNLAMGGNYTGGTIDNNAFGTDGHQMLVDYVRVYQCGAGANACRSR